MDDKERIVLTISPDGSETEILVTEEEARALRHAPAGCHNDILCRACKSDLILPLDWESIDDALWLVTVRCPDCRVIYETTFSRDGIEDFVEQLHAHKRALARDLARWSLGGFINDAERFVAALMHDDIQPIDF